MIYCVEDDESIRELILYALKSSGFEAEGFSCASELEQGLRTLLPELFILDIMLPDKDGVAILKDIRGNSRTKNIPVIMATAKGSEFDKVMGLDNGADDYIVKPVGMMELIARVKAILRRVKTTDLEILSIGNIVLELQKRVVKIDNKEVNLTFKEFEVLHMLMREPERVFNRDSILNAVWGYNFDGETRTVDVHIRSLRAKLEGATAQIQTFRGIGYSISNGAHNEK